MAGENGSQNSLHAQSAHYVSDYALFISLRPARTTTTTAVAILFLCNHDFSPYPRPAPNAHDDDTMATKSKKSTDTLASRLALVMKSGKGVF